MRVGVCILVSLITAGCGARTSRSVDVPQSSAAPPADTPATPSAPPAMSLLEFMAKARVAAAQARPPARPQVAQIESTNSRLAAAIVQARTTPSSLTLRQVADEYHRLGIDDRAHDYLHRALLLDPRDGVTYDALARLWRDGGMLDLALADAHRALYYAPNSAAARNTLGTVFQALGRRKQAREQYERALALDPEAAYALNNLCYGWILDREPGKAVKACEAALKVKPDLAAARNNLGLAHAASGNLNATRGAFERVGDPATALYNLGIVHMARREYSDAVSAFAAAQQARPSLRMATRRANQATRLAMAGAD